MADRSYEITLFRQDAPRIFDSLWTKTWAIDEPLPSWYFSALQQAEPILGYGIVEPLELRVHKRELVVLSYGQGRTLTEFLYSARTVSESSARTMVEQLCFALLRLHHKTGVYGALVPFNVLLTKDNLLKIWSAPSGRLELSYGSNDSHWETPFRSPQLLQGATPTPEDDIYALGQVLARLLGELSWDSEFQSVLECSDEITSVFQKCVKEDPKERFSSIEEFTMALRSDSQLFDLDLKGAEVSKSLAASTFLENRISESFEHWQDACKKDWLDLTTHANLAVCLMRQERWLDAIYCLEKAYKMAICHPVLDTNIGICLHKLGDRIASDFWLNRGSALNPKCYLAHRAKAKIAASDKNESVALEEIRRGLLLNPRCAESRLIAADILEEVGEKTEAQRHRIFAEKCVSTPAFYDHLLLKHSPPPWTLVMGEERSSVAERIGCRRAPLPGRSELVFAHHWSAGANTKPLYEGP